MGEPNLARQFTRRSSEQIPTIKILGERNTGTNYLAQLLAVNLEVSLLPGVVPTSVARAASGAEKASRTLGGHSLRLGEALKDAWFAVTFPRNLGWKHAAIRDDLERFELAHHTTFVTLTKNPYSWLLSLYRRPYHAWARHGSFSEFITSPWRTVRREHAPRVLPSVVELWNYKNASYLTLGQSFRVVNLRYEDVLDDPATAIEMVKRTSGATKTSSHVTNVLKSAKGDQLVYDDYRSYYLEERWLSHLSNSDIHAVNLRLDEGTTEHFGYRFIRPTK